MKEKITDVWEQLQEGISNKQLYNNKSTGDNNERFYSGDQWYGISLKNLPQITLNVLKQIVDTQIAYILSNKRRIRFMGMSPSFIQSEDEKNLKEQGINANIEPKKPNFSDMIWKDNWLDKLAQEKWEQDGMEYKLYTLLLHSKIRGNYCTHTYWDKYGQSYSGLTGDFCTEIVNPNNIYFGDVNTREVSKQPYILIAGRKTVLELKQMAEKDGEPNLIIGDSDTFNSEGDRSQHEIGDKATYVIKYFKEWDKKGNKCLFYCEIATKTAIIRKKFDIGLTRYPICWGVNDERDSSYLGEASITQLISSQVAYNKELSLAIKSAMDTAFPKIGYNKLLMTTPPSNAVGQSIGVNGNPVEALHIFQGAGMDTSAIQMPQILKSAMHEVGNISQAMLGISSATSAAAINSEIANATKPLEKHSAELNRFIEDLGRIWLDFIQQKYGDRDIFYEIDDGLVNMKIPSEQLKKVVFKTKVDVIEPKEFNDTETFAQLSNAFMNNQLDPYIYFKIGDEMGAFPNGTFKEFMKTQQQAQQMPQMPQQLGGGMNG